jgi:hypothetical protein
VQRHFAVEFAELPANAESELAFAYFVRQINLLAEFDAREIGGLAADGRGRRPQRGPG